MITRRALLGCAGLAGGALALFPWLREAEAQSVPRRLVLFYTPHGTVWDRWRPAGGETDFTLSPILEPLARHRSSVVIVDGIAMRSGTTYYIPHTYTMPVLWTGSPIDTAARAFCRMDHMQCFGWNTGVSVDQAIAARLNAADVPRPTIELGVGAGGLHPANRMIYSAPGAPKNPLDDPARAFATLFGGGLPGEAAAIAAARRRASVLDAVRGDFSSIQRALSPADRARLDAHATSLRELERSLVASTTSCTRPSAPTGVDSATIIDRQSDLLAASLGCGLTRIASLQVRVADNDSTLYPWAGLTASGHHLVSHDSGAAAQATLAAVYRWYSERFAHLLDRLAATPSAGGGSVLDHTLVIWGSELGRGYDHDISNVPFVFAGGAGGRLRGGRYLRVTGLRSNRVLVTAFHAMGLSDVQRYGSLDDGSGPVPGVLM